MPVEVHPVPVSRRPALDRYETCRGTDGCYRGSTDQEVLTAQWPRLRAAAERQGERLPRAAWSERYPPRAAVL